MSAGNPNCLYFTDFLDKWDVNSSSRHKYKRSVSTKSPTKRDATLRLREILSREKEKGNDDIQKRLKAIQNLQLEVIALVGTLNLYISIHFIVA